MNELELHIATGINCKTMLGTKNKLQDTYHKCPLYEVFLNVDLFILRERVRRGEAERERIPSRLCTDSAELDTGLELTNCEIIT